MSIGVRNGFKWYYVLCGIKCVNLNKETVKILGAQFSYIKNLEQDKQFSEYIVKMENILKL